ncbi:MAG: hypothetical protein LBQ68_04445 [Clostridiales bacterium]|jgi:hypothetical protein|nr:hypothetical protein [Clostridiales bacterium]
MIAQIRVLIDNKKHSSQVLQYELQYKDTEVDIVQKRMYDIINIITNESS